MTVPTTDLSREAPSGALSQGTAAFTHLAWVPNSASVASRETVHATCLVVGEVGVLIRGASGAGKSTLALALIDGTALRGDRAVLVGDDRVRLSVVDGRLSARPHPAIAGLIEIRGTGIVAIASVASCVLGLVVDLVDDATRTPESFVDTTILGIALPRLRIDRTMRDAGLAPRCVLDSLGVSSQPHTPLPGRRILPSP